MSRTERSGRWHLAVVAQTPFHYLISTILASSATAENDLWLIDPALRPHVDAARASGLWSEVRYAERITSTHWFARESPLARIERFAALRRTVSAYLDERRPDGVLVFADNHEVMASFGEQAKRRGMRVVLAEDAEAGFIPPRSTRAPLLKGLVRRALGIPNPWGFNAGWSSWPDALLLSRPASAEPAYVRDRRVVAWPAGPFPDPAIRSFARLWSGGEQPGWPSVVDAVLLGQPLTEAGAASPNWEAEVLERVRALDETHALLVKPHPFDTDSKYARFRNVLGARSTWGSAPAQVMLHLLRPPLVITFGSSAAVSYVTRYGGRALFIVPSTDAASVIVPSLQRELADLASVRVTTSVAEIPAQAEEMLAMVPLETPSSASADAWREALAAALQPARAGGPQGWSGT